MTKQEIFDMISPEEGMIKTAEDSSESFMFKNGKWEQIELNSQPFSMNLYDLNKSIMSQLDIIEEFGDKILLINEFKDNTNNQFYMLYGKEISYFTVFMTDFPEEDETIGEAAIDCLRSIGDITSVDLTQNHDAIECWVRDEQGLDTCLYLFPYDQGMIFVGG